MSRRRGFSSLVFIVLTAVILAIWGVAQHYTSANVRRRVLIAEAGRRCLLQATTAVEEGLEVFSSQMNEGPPPGTPEKPDSLFRRARRIAPGELVEFHYAPPVAALPGGGPPVRLTAVTGKLFIVTLDGAQGSLPASASEAAYKAYLLKWSRIPGCPAEMLTDELKIFRNYRPPTAKGILEFSVTATAAAAGVVVSKRVVVRHQIQMSASPYPGALAEVMGVGLASLMHVEPIELGRRIFTTVVEPPKAKS